MLTWEPVCTPSVENHFFISQNNADSTTTFSSFGVTLKKLSHMHPYPQCLAYFMHIYTIKHPSCMDKYIIIAWGIDFGSPQNSFTKFVLGLWQDRPVRLAYSSGCSEFLGHGENHRKG